MFRTWAVGVGVGVLLLLGCSDSTKPVKYSGYEERPWLRLIPDAYVRADGPPIDRDTAWAAVDCWRKKQKGVATFRFVWISQPLREQHADQHFFHFITDVGPSWKHGFTVQRSTGLVFESLWAGVKAPYNVLRQEEPEPAEAGAAGVGAGSGPIGRPARVLIAAIALLVFLGCAAFATRSRHHWGCRAALRWPMIVALGIAGAYVVGVEKTVAFHQPGVPYARLTTYDIALVDMVAGGLLGCAIGWLAAPVAGLVVPLLAARLRASLAVLKAKTKR
jgi:hypothetical protein